MPNLKPQKTRDRRQAAREKKERKMAGPEKAALPNGDAPEGANVDKIRDILFGSQMREYEKRFSRLEERLTKTLDSIRDDAKKRFDSLETFTQQEIESLAQRLKNEKGERTDGLKELTSELRTVAKSLEKKLSQVEEQMAGGHGDLRARILEQSKSLSREIEEMHKEMSATLDTEVQNLRSEKTDRAALADLFNECALRLNNEFTLPEK